MPRLRDRLEQETYCKLLPGYVRNFVEKSLPLLDLGLSGDLDGAFSLHALKPGVMDAIWPALETYPEFAQHALTIHRPKDRNASVFLHPGEPVFDAICDRFCSRYAGDALRGGVFVDPLAGRPYFVHLALVRVLRGADSDFAEYAQPETLDCRLVGLKYDEDGRIEEIPVEYLQLLSVGSGVPPGFLLFLTRVRDAISAVSIHLSDSFIRGLVEQRRHELLDALPEREDLLRRGYDYQEAELAARRVQLREKAEKGDAKARTALLAIRDQQRQLAGRREAALASFRREPELIEAEPFAFLAHAMVVPTADPEERKKQNAMVEDIAVKVAWAYEEARGATVRDVSDAAKARAAGLIDWPGFDLLAKKIGDDDRCIEVKGRAGVGEIEISENEWAKACNLRERYWLYAVFDCGSSHPKLVRVNDPFRKLLARAKGSMLISHVQLKAAENDPNTSVDMGGRSDV